jgi:rhodanese-related sulfurtransferase
VITGARLASGCRVGPYAHLRPDTTLDDGAHLISAAVEFPVLMKTISGPELAAWLADEGRTKPQLLDVREPWEHERARIEGYELITMQTIPHSCTGSSRRRLICHHGGRSMHVAMYLARHGFNDVYNLTGGVDAWARQVDPAVPTY